MKKYELTYLVSPEPNDIESQNIETEIKSFIGNNGEVINVKTDPARRDLGVEINKKKTAKMISILFVLPPSQISELEKILKGSSVVLRHILINKPDIKSNKKRGEKSDEPIFGVEKKSLDKIELKDIDKKIEEILSE